MRAAALLCLLLPLTLAKNFSFAGYLPEWRYEGANWHTLSSHLTHLILFSAEPLPSGELTGLDRFPRAELLAEARAAAAAHGCKLLLCFGGNGRSSGFSAMSRNKHKRARFVAAVGALLQSTGTDGVDLNWEYPGYAFGSGYMSDAEVNKDYVGLAAVARELRAALGSAKAITLAYYPDGCVPSSPLQALQAICPAFCSKNAHSRPHPHTTQQAPGSPPPQARPAQDS